MKKILTTLMVAMLMAIVPMNLFAEGDTDLGNNPTSGTVELYANVASEYSVKFPSRVDVTPTSKTFNVYAKGDIASDETLTISYDNSSEIKLVDVNTSGKEDIALNISVTGNTFTYETLPVNYSDTSALFTITHAAITAGAYEADLPLVISLA